MLKVKESDIEPTKCCEAKQFHKKLKSKSNWIHANNPLKSNKPNDGISKFEAKKSL